MNPADNDGAIFHFPTKPRENYNTYILNAIFVQPDSELVRAFISWSFYIISKRCLLTAELFLYRHFLW